ncbi:unnamed protein product [Alopecurus aequalis]
MLKANEHMLCSLLARPHRRVAAPLFESSCCSQHRRRNTRRLCVACSRSGEHVSRLHANERRFIPPICMGTHNAMDSCSAQVKGSLAGETASLQNAEYRIRKQLEKPEFMPSPYDTAWVAMVPLPDSDFKAPCFPRCVQWIMLNQHGNGSWGMNESVLSANKEIMLSTMACVIALKKWKAGPEHIRRGLVFIGRNFSIVMDPQVAAPIGFNIIFPGMLSLATGIGLDFSVTKAHIASILHLRDMQLNRLVGQESGGREAYLAYVAQGLVNMVDWNKVMKYKRKNGSLFNSPAATAASLVHKCDYKSLQYLNFIVTTLDGAVPAVYPLNIYCQLSLVNTLENIGISRYFAREIKSVLDKTYRMNGYDVSSDELAHVAEISAFQNTLQGYLNDTKSLIELYKASKVCFSENESILDNICYWSGRLLKEKLNSGEMQNSAIFGEVECALKYPYCAVVEPVYHRRNIEHFEFCDSGILKRTSLPCFIDRDLLDLAVRNFSVSQCVYQDEVEQLERWQKGNRLDLLNFVRKNVKNNHLAAVASISPHELSAARMACAKTIALIPVVDDLFDVGGSIEEIQNLILLVERWNDHQNVEWYSDKVKLVFSALYTTVNQLGDLASAVQNRDVTEHMVEAWLDYLKSLLTEADWQRTQYVPTVEEYMKNAIVALGVGPIMLTTLYFAEQNQWEHVVKEREYQELFTLMGTCGRLLNDTQTFERERRDGQLNSVALLVLRSRASMSIEEARTVIEKSIACYRRQLLRLVVKQDGVVPKTCKELFWGLYKTSHMFYSQSDGYTSPKKMLGMHNLVIDEPLKLQASRMKLQP